jgi:hypothetical protein
MSDDDVKILLSIDKLDERCPCGSYLSIAVFVGGDETIEYGFTFHFKDHNDYKAVLIC